MGLWDFLKGIIPEKFINVDNTISINDNRKIEISNSQITFGNQTINDSKMVKEVLDKLTEYKNKDSLPCQIVHKDLNESYIQYEEITIDQKESLRKLRTVLPVEEVECILMARRVKLAYDKQDVDLAKKLHKQLLDNYSEKGRKVYNLIGGGYFDEMVIPFIEIFQSQYDVDGAVEYQKFYYEIIKFFSLAFFVGNGTTKDQIIFGINKRLELTVPFVRLHAIGRNNINKIEEVIDKLKINDKYSIKDTRFRSPAGLNAQILEIKIKNSKSNK